MFCGQDPTPSLTPTTSIPLHPPLRTRSQVGRNGLPTCGSASGASCRRIFWVAFDYLLRQWGTPELTERAAHDLFFNVRSLAPALSRLRLFGAFSGCLPSEDSGPSFEGDVDLQDEEALAFYLRAVVTFHRIREEIRSTGDGAAGDSGVAGRETAGSGDAELNQ